MAISAGITFGAAKAELATVVANGVDKDDPRVMSRTNEAIQILLRGKMIPVGAMATYDVVAGGPGGTQLFLPKELENAIEVEVLGGQSVNGSTDVTVGSYDLVNQFAYVDPATAHDNPLVDLFLDVDPVDHTVLRRKYDYPGLDMGATVRVTGKKRYIPIKEDGDSLIIQNIPAIKAEIMAREYLERGSGGVDDSIKYHAIAEKEIGDEIVQHQLDPRRILKRKSDYQKDIVTYAEGTLGRTRGRLALELPSYLLKGKSEITYLINRAVQMLVDNRNQLAITGRISVHGSIDEIMYSPAIGPADVLPWSDYNQIRLMIQSFNTEDLGPQALAAAEEYQKRAFSLQEAQLIQTTEKLRHTTYTNDLETYVSGTFGYMTARLALELPNGLQMTRTEIERLLSMAEMRIMERGKYKGTIKTLSAQIMGGEILFPRDVEGIIAADVFGFPIHLRSIFFEYTKNGPGHIFACERYFIDQGEVYFPQTGGRRRKYIYKGNRAVTVPFDCVAKIRWVQKEACDEMTIKNFEAIRLFVQSIIAERGKDWQNAAPAQAAAINILERELNEYLSGIEHTQNVDTSAGYGLGDLGCPL